MSKLARRGLLFPFSLVVFAGRCECVFPLSPLCQSVLFCPLAQMGTALGVRQAILNITKPFYASRCASFLTLRHHQPPHDVRLTIPWPSRTSPDITHSLASSMPTAEPHPERTPTLLARRTLRAPPPTPSYSPAASLASPPGSPAASAVPIPIPLLHLTSSAS